MTPASFSQPVGVVIVDEGVEAAEVRRHLGDWVPLRIVSWQDPSYLSAISALRPQVLIVWGAEEEQVYERCQLIASLFSNFAPTTISATFEDALLSAPRLVVQYLGTGATVKIADLSDVLLP